MISQVRHVPCRTTFLKVLLGRGQKHRFKVFGVDAENIEHHYGVSEQLWISSIIPTSVCFNQVANAFHDIAFKGPLVR